MIAGINITSPRTSAALTPATLLVTDGDDKLWKYIAVQGNIHDAAWAGPEYPDGNVTIGPKCNPCLFELRLDPEERHDLSTEQPELTARLAAELANETHFQTGQDHYVGEYTQCVNMTEFSDAHRGFLGPVCDKVSPVAPESVPPPPAPPVLQDVYVAGANDTAGVSYACFRIPTLLITPNVLIAFAEGRRSGCNDQGDVRIVQRTSHGARKLAPFLHRFLMKNDAFTKPGLG